MKGCLPIINFTGGEELRPDTVFSRALKNSFSCYLSMLHMAPIFFFKFLIARDNGLQNGKGISSENGLSFCLHGWMNGEVGANSRRFTPDLAWYSCWKKRIREGLGGEGRRGRGKQEE